MVELSIYGNAVELKRSNNGIKYTMQIADVLNIANVSASYTNSFTIPKTPYNTTIFQQLGIIGDTSQIPYERVPATLKYHGFSIVRSGWLQINETTEEYRVNIIDGIIDFFKAIENKTMGADLDLSIFNHTKNIATVLASFDNPNYKYLIADYNGNNIAQVEETVGINIDYQIPCFSVQKLWDIVFETFGFTYNSSLLDTFLNELYLTYPKPPQEGNEPVLLSSGTKEPFNSSSFGNWQGQKYVPSQEFWSETTGTWQNNWQYVIPEDGSYFLEVTTEAYARFRHPISNNEFNLPATIHLIVNGTSIASIPTDPLMGVTLSETLVLNEGDVVQVRITSTPNYDFLELYQIRHNSTEFNVSSLSLGEVSLNESLKDFAIKDFIKEIIWRTGLTPVIDVDTRHIEFIELADRIDFDNAVDWTDKYVQRLSENYDIGGSYAQKNVLQLKHNNEVDTYGNGYFYVNNKNLKDEQVIVDSKLFAPEWFNFRFPNASFSLSVPTYTFRVWEKEPKTDEEGNLEIDYKGLNNRYYFMRPFYTGGTFAFVSEFLEETGESDGVPFGNGYNTLFDELVFQNYAGYEEVLNNFRRHKIELALGLNDIITLDLTKPVYFGQEGQFYILNKLDWEEGKTNVGEFIRINKL